MNLLKIKNKFKCYKLCFLNWKNGNGFQLPDPNEREKCFYAYCEKIVNDTLKNQIWAYEEDIVKYINTETITRKDIARTYIQAYNEIFGEEKFQ